MHFLGYAILLVLKATVQSGEPATRRPDKVVEKLLGEQVINVHTGSEAGLHLYGKWVDQALSSLMAAVAQEHLPLAPPATVILHKECAKRANSVKKHAKCVVRLLDEHVIQPKHIKLREDFRRKREVSSVVRRGSYSLQSPREENVFNALTHMVTGLVRRGKGKGNARNWEAVYSAVMEQKKAMDRKRLFSDTMLLRQGKEKLGTIPEEQEILLKMLKEGINLGLKVTGQNGTTEEEVIKFLSPRFLSIVPEEREDKEQNFLSPSLFSLHGRGKGIERESSLHGLLARIDPKAPDNLLEMITEVSGLTDAVEEAEKKSQEQSLGTIANSQGKLMPVSRDNLTEIYGEDGYRTMKVLERLHSNYDDEQIVSMNRTGYTVMNSRQLELVYGKGSPFEDRQVLERNRNLTEAVVKREIAKVSSGLNTGHPVSLGTVSCDSVRDRGSPSYSPTFRSPFTLSPFVLSPFVLSPAVLSPSIVGGLVLSPYALSPIRASPPIGGGVIFGSPSFLS